MAPPSVKTSSETDLSDMEASGTTLGHLFSSVSGYPTRTLHSPLSPNSTHTLSPKEGASSVENRHPYSVRQTTESNGYNMENNDISWNEIEYFLDTPMKNSDQNSQLEWANQLISVDDVTLDANWSDLLVDSNLPESEPKLPDLPPNASSCQPQFPQLPHHPLPNAASSKARMRWTPELHEAFVDSVNKLGGCERATPKGVLMLMNVEGLTIYHVKSHLQKYRTARFKPESPEGTPEKKAKTTNDMPSLDLKTTMGITEALRIQMEVQKQLHEQLEIQRTLQIRIEEQGKRLREMFEQQRKLEEEKGKAASSNADRPQTPTTEKTPCTGNDKSQSSRINSPSTKESTADYDHAPKRSEVDEMAALESPHES